MLKRRLLLATLLFASIAGAREKTENWVEVHSPHFRVITNSSEKQGRHVADQFERMRDVFHKLFPKLQIDPGDPIIVLAVKDEKDFRSLEPAEYLAKGQLKLAGYFLRGQDKNYVLMRLEAEGEHPYSTIYHEYTHLLLSKADWMPLWMNEGLAQFYQNTDIHEKEVALGQPDFGDMEFLRQNRLLPLPTLFTVDAKSPYYHEENKGSIFYAESWALTHYLYQRDFREHRQTLTDYAQLLAQNVDPVTAASRAFGDLKQLQSTLEGYVRQGIYGYFRMASTDSVDPSAFQATPLTSTRAEAIRADLLAYNGRLADAQALIDHVLKDDPENVSARETLGFMAVRQGHTDEARKLYAEAVKLDSQSYLAHYYYAAISMNGAVAADEEGQVEKSFNACITLNSSFGPCYDRLAVFLGMRHRDLDHARMMALNAIQLEPANLGYRLNMASVLLAMERGDDAVNVIKNAIHLAKTPEEVTSAQNFLEHAEEFAQMQAQNKQFNEQMKMRAAEVNVTSQVYEASPAKLAHAEVVPKGPHHFIVGLMKNVHCDNPALTLDVISGTKTLPLHAPNYFTLEYSALNFKPSGNINPCSDLEGRSAKVEYVNAEDKNVSAFVLSIELHK